MSKQPLGRDTGFPEVEERRGTGLDQTTVLIASTILIIVVIMISSIVNYVIIKSTVSSAVEKAVRGESEAADTDDEAIVKQGIMIDLGDFVLNLADSSPRRYLKINVAVELSTTEEEDKFLATPQKGGGHGAEPKNPKDILAAELDQYKPAIRDAIISVLSAKTSDELSSSTGKEVAKEEIQDLVSSVFNGQREVLRISFGQFIIQ